MQLYFIFLDKKIKHNVENTKILADSFPKMSSISSNGSSFQNQNMGSLIKKQRWQLPQTSQTFAFVPLQPSINTINTRQPHLFQNNMHRTLPVSAERSHKLRRSNQNKKESIYSLLSNKNFASRYSRTIGAAKISSSYKKEKRYSDLLEAQHQNDIEIENK